MKETTERLLIVEDEKIIGLDLQHRLERQGYTVVDLVASGEEALECVRDQTVDLVLMDIMLGGALDGIETAQRIRAEFGIPVIFLTAYADEATLQRAKKAEPFGYVLKPFKERELFSTIEISLYTSAMDRRLRRQERWLTAILDSVGDAILAVDRDELIQFMNPVAAVLTGWKEEEARGQPLENVLKLYDEQTTAAVNLPDLEGQNPDFPSSFESVYLQSKHGAKISIKGSYALIKEAGQAILGRVLTFRDVSEMRSMSATLTYQASHDVLTGLINREEFFLKLETLFRQAQTGGGRHSFIYIDIDQFRLINDVCGHVAGDELLRETAAHIEGAIKSVGVIGRLGGDEFGILLPDTDLPEASKIAHKVLRTLQRTFIWERHSYRIKASAGVVPILSEFQDVYTILAAANDACHLAKEQGGNRIKVYESNAYFHKRHGEMIWISRLTRALEEDRFVLFYQPIVALNGRSSLKKIEILLRLEEADGELIMPSQFIPAAEHYNLMSSIDRWVIRKVFAFCRRLHKTGLPPGIVISINLSASSLSDDGLFSYITEQFIAHGVEASTFCFEITETAAIANLERAQLFIRNLKGAGCTFALDDFGNGFSSFAYLKTLQVDYLKIDGSYVKNLAEDPIDFAMVQAVNSIGHIMGMQTIAEYVHSLEVLSVLKSIGVDFAQGYHLALPQRLDERSLLNA